jgi:hypothetical protein
MKVVIFSLLIFLSINCWSQTITGEVIDTDTNKPLNNANVYLVQPGNTEDTINIIYWEQYRYKIIEQTKTDSLGKYFFTSLIPQAYNIIAEFEFPSLLGGYRIRNDIDSNVIIKLNTIHYRNFYLMVTCPYDKTKKQFFCPKCKKEDMVLPILWGLPLYDENGIINGGKPYYPGGCASDFDCRPSKHCNRCDKDF